MYDNDIICIIFQDFQKSDLRVADLFVEQLSDGALRLGRDLLRLVADVQLGDLA